MAWKDLVVTWESRGLPDNPWDYNGWVVETGAWSPESTSTTGTWQCTEDDISEGV